MHRLRRPRRLHRNGATPSGAGACRALPRGFSLVELMVVVVIIGVISVLALPNISRRLRDRKVADSAERVAAIYRGARTRAMARGGAVLVRYTAATGVISVQEAVGAWAGCSSLPTSSCLLTPWGSPGASVVTETFDPAGVSPDLRITLTTGDPATPVTPAVHDVCFTPLGRSLERVTAGGQFNTLNGAPELRLLRGPDSAPIGLVRTVVLLPTGQARVGTAVGP